MTLRLPDPGGGGSSRHPVVTLLGVATLFFLLGALVQDGIDRFFLGVVAAVTGMAFLLVATRGTRAHGVARGVAALGGGVVVVTALGVAAGSIWMIVVQGGLGILVGIVGLPAAFVLGILGRLLIQMARSGLDPRGTAGGRGGSPLPPAAAPPARGPEAPEP